MSMRRCSDGIIERTFSGRLLTGCSLGATTLVQKFALFALSVFALFLCVVPSVRAAGFDQSLSYGMGGLKVVELQDFLTEQGCFNHSSTGFFGAITLSAVKCFQAKYGIIQTGYFGVLSRAQANTLLTEMLAPSVEEEAQEQAQNPAPQATSTPPAPVQGQNQSPAPSNNSNQNQNVDNTPVAVIPRDVSINIGSGSKVLEGNNTALTVSISDTDLTS